MKKLLHQNKILYWLGCIHALLAIALLIYYPFHKINVLGINAVIKPIKFALSIWILSWSMAFILNYVNDKRNVKIYSGVAVVCLGFEQVAITFQAMRGQLSHFNKSDAFGIILYSMMGIFILTVTLWTAYITYIFIKQKEYKLHSTIVLSIKFGLIYFVIFSLFGGYMSGLQGHTVGAVDGGAGVPFLNWSTAFGDLRVAHFFGMHSLQLVPLVGIVASKYFGEKSSIRLVWIFSMLYFVFIFIVTIQAMYAMPFITLVK
jgi:hypothetical protein